MIRGPWDHDLTKADTQTLKQPGATLFSEVENIPSWRDLNTGSILFTNRNSSEIEWEGQAPRYPLKKLQR